MKKSICAVVLAFLLASFSAIGFAAQAVTNKDIVSMIKAGLSSAVILQTIQTSPGQYDTSPQALIALKAGNVPDAVIAAMLSKSTGTAQPAASSSQASIVNPISTDSMPTQVGVYLVISPGHYQPIAQEIAHNGSGHGFLNKVVTKELVTELKGSTSQTTVNSVAPQFLAIQTRDNEINLYPIKEVKKDKRVIASKSMWSTLGGNIGEPDFIATERNVVQGRTHCYFIRPSTSLQNGEYTFLEMPKDARGMHDLHAWSFTVRTTGADPTANLSAGR